MNSKKRPYRLKSRAESRDRTRQRIVEAAIELHQAKGIAATSMNDIAERAGVGKVTVYRHFSDEAALVGACSGQYFRRHPFPDPEDWHAIADPHERLRRGLSETYAYHRETEPMIARVLPEARGLPVIAPYDDHWRRTRWLAAQSRSTQPTRIGSTWARVKATQPSSMPSFSGAASMFPISASAR